MKILCFEIKYIGFKFDKTEEEIVKILLEKESIITAIKYYRGIEYCSLMEAKDYCVSVREKYFPKLNIDNVEPYKDNIYKDKLDKKYHKKFKKYLRK